MTPAPHRSSVSPRRLLSGAVALALAACAGGEAGQDAAPAAAPAATPIAAVQGAGARSPLEGREVVVEGVVTRRMVGLDGLFVQDPTGDGDPATSEGLWVEYPRGSRPVLRSGDRVRLAGTVAENGPPERGMTTLRGVRAEVLERGLALPAPVALAEGGAREAIEGMRVRVEGTLTVSGNDGLLRFGELATAFGGRLYAPTERHAPGAEAQALADANAARALVLDDRDQRQYPEGVRYLAQPQDATRPLRAGSTLEGVEGLLEQRFGGWRVQLTDAIGAIAEAPRPAPPVVEGDVRIVGLNMLNLFNGDGLGVGFPTERGAASAEAYARQQAKLVATLRALDPAIAALQEVENDGDGEHSALAQLVDALNAAEADEAARDWRFVPSAALAGGDAIRVAILYRAQRVRAVGAPASTAEGPFARGSRPPLLQAFRAGDGPVFAVASNHFKSKGGCEDAEGGNRDLRDFQGCWNAARVEAARALADWLASDPTGQGAGAAMTLVLGDLNAHAEEDPLRLLREAGWRDAFAVAAADPDGAPPHSFVFRGEAARLDHALLGAGLAERLRGAAEWHANADEGEAFHYSRDASAEGAASPWRASDHDPMLLGLDLRR